MCRVDVNGVPVYGVIDSGSDITVMCGTLVCKVALEAKLCKKDLKPPEKTPCGYDQRPFELDGKMDLTVSFERKVLTTPVYIKINTDEPLQLSEKVCQQLYYRHVHLRLVKVVQDFIFRPWICTILTQCQWHIASTQIPASYW